jgi:hypothetical protein
MVISIGCTVLKKLIGPEIVQDRVRRSMPAGHNGTVIASHWIWRRKGDCMAPFSQAASAR